ncbi:hypothetical protein IPA_08835 [Ignicoccus pacificus DSM 13166]|uniref:DUF2079 domain-containing protein n=1 Tax=Ignicoccus pacificus DSM 13166 TaxID=940294 RepID=A0A977PLU6_9CREN|nr:hypothetical protein IPA_08835 [Ignicoccus pacificus DSM 13166]
MVLYVAWFSLYSVVRFDRFQMGAFDMGIFTQSTATFAEHNLLLWNNVEFGGASHFAVHNQPILFLVGLIYKLFPNPRTLLILQSFALALASAFIYMFSKEKIGKTLALVLAISYLLHPATHGINAFDFHPVSLGPLLIAATIYLLEKDSPFWPLLALLSLTVKEDAGIALIALGMYYILKKRLRRAIALLIMGALWIYVSINVIIPHFSPIGKYLFIKKKTLTLESLTCCYLQKLAYSLSFPLPIAYVNLLTIEGILLYLIPLGELIAYPIRSYYAYGFQYPYMLLPLTYFGATLGLSKLKKKIAERSIAYIILTLTLLFMIVYDPTPLSLNGAFRPLLNEIYPSAAGLSKFYPWPSPSPHYHNLQLLLEKMRTLPEEFPILVSDRAFTHMADRLGTLYSGTYPPWVIVQDGQLDGKRAIVLTASLVGWRLFNRLYVPITNFDDIIVYVMRDKVGMVKQLIPWNETQFKVLFIFFKNLRFKGKVVYAYYSDHLGSFWNWAPGPGLDPDRFSGALCSYVKASGRVVAKSDEGIKVIFNGKTINEKWEKEIIMNLKGDGLLVVLFKDTKGRAWVKVEGSVTPLKGPSVEECLKEVSAHLSLKR